jgi:hypothetical protein
MRKILRSVAPVSLSLTFLAVLAVGGVSAAAAEV